MRRHTRAALLALVAVACSSDAGDACLEDEIWPDNGYCYHVVERDLVWADVESDCITRGGHLVSWHSEEEYQFLSHTVQPGDQAFWTGLNDRAAEATLEWSDGSPVTYIGHLFVSNQSALDCIGYAPLGLYGTVIYEDCETTHHHVCKLRP